MYKSGSSSDFPANLADGASPADFELNMTDTGFNEIFASVSAPSESTYQYLPQDFSIAENASEHISHSVMKQHSDNAHQSQAMAKVPRLSLQSTLF